MKGVEKKVFEVRAIRVGLTPFEDAVQKWDRFNTALENGWSLLSPEQKADLTRDHKAVSTRAQFLVAKLKIGFAAVPEGA